MAENKKGFILYADLIHVVKKLPSKKAGELFLHILQYVNDENPTTDDLLVDLTFEPIKQQLKRDLVKFEQIKEKRSNAGKISADNKKAAKVLNEESKSTNSTHVESVEHILTNSTVIVNDNVTVNDTVINKNTNVISLRANCEFRFGVKTKVYAGFPSDLAKSNEHLLYLQNVMYGKQLSMNEFSEYFDQKHVSQTFDNERHFQAAIRKSITELTQQKNETNKSSYKRNFSGTEAIESGKVKHFGNTTF